MRATSAEVKGTRPLDIGKPRLLRDNSTCRYGVTVSSRRRAAIKRSNSSFSFGGSDSTAASISARVVTTKAYHINIAANKEFHSYQAPVPTTKILAISHFMDTPMTPAQLAQIMPHEVHDTVNAYLAGKIDQWYYRTDGNGVVFIVNASTPEEAKNILEKFPLVQAGLMGFHYIPRSAQSAAHHQ